MSDFTVPRPSPMRGWWTVEILLIVSLPFVGIGSMGALAVALLIPNERKTQVGNRLLVGVGTATASIIWVLAVLAAIPVAGLRWQIHASAIAGLVGGLLAIGFLGTAKHPRVRALIGDLVLRLGGWVGAVWTWVAAPGVGGWIVAALLIVSLTPGRGSAPKPSAIGCASAGMLYWGVMIWVFGCCAADNPGFSSATFYRGAALLQLGVSVFLLGLLYLGALLSRNQFGRRAPARPSS